jgi:hypothetical protein
VTLHPAKLLIAYLVESSGETEIEATATEMAITLQKCIVVQHLQTRQILWSMLFAESAAVLLSSRNSTEDVLLSKMGESKMFKFAKDQFGKLQYLQFLDPPSFVLEWICNTPDGCC